MRLTPPDPRSLDPRPFSSLFYRRSVALEWRGERECIINESAMSSLFQRKMKKIFLKDKKDERTQGRRRRPDSRTPGQQDDDSNWTPGRQDNRTTAEDRRTRGRPGVLLSFVVVLLSCCPGIQSSSSVVVVLVSLCPVVLLPPSKFFFIFR